MDGFDEVRLPVYYSEGAIGGVTFSTVVIGVDSGAEQVIAQWAYGLHRWEIAYQEMSVARGRELDTFFRCRRGRARGFRFKDWADFSTLTPQPVLLNPNGAYQLAKLYTSGDQTYTRWISKPVSGKVQLIGPGTLDYTTGVVTGASEDSTLWSGEFDVPVRFDTDAMKLAQTEAGVRSWSAIPIVEVRL